ncbi:hypothetical protein [Marinomonas shanghaiensis]|uniref:hypothetical protein n=1 Tax=Marinomonas shanghaiensis TaxID=2202418 RepID=UPI000DBA57DD|nr:hypothetical protein [Marinomonas shanghaiensis]
MTTHLSSELHFSNKKVELTIAKLINHIDYVQFHLGIRLLFDKMPTILTPEELKQVICFFRSKGVRIGVIHYDRARTNLRIDW